jgi:hypothetical protein
MKITKLFLLSCLICIAGACNDDDDDDSSAMTSEEAADVVASSLAINSSGLATVVDASVSAADAAVEASTGGRTAACGYSDQESFTATSTPGAIITYAYNYTYSYLLTCGVDVPQSLSVTSSYTGEFDAPRLASQHTGASDFTVTALDESASSYIINGGYNRAGAFQSKIRNKNSSTSTVNFIVDALTKLTRRFLVEVLPLQLPDRLPAKAPLRIPHPLYLKAMAMPPLPSIAMYIVLTSSQAQS